MDDLRYLKKAKLGGFSIGKGDYLELVRFIKDQNIMTVLEFGPGGSTWAFLEADCQIKTIEYEHKFYLQAKETFARFHNVEVFHVEKTHPIKPPEAIKGASFDLCLVDSPFGGYYRYFSRLNSCIYAMGVTDTILLHDAMRKKEKMTLRFLADSGWELSYLDKRKSKFVVCRRKKDYQIPLRINGLPLPFKI